MPYSKLAVLERARRTNLTLTVSDARDRHLTRLGGPRPARGAAGRQAPSCCLRLQTGKLEEVLLASRILKLWNLRAT